MTLWRSSSPTKSKKGFGQVGGRARGGWRGWGLMRVGDVAVAGLRTGAIGVSSGAAVIATVIGAATGATGLIGESPGAADTVTGPEVTTTGTAGWWVLDQAPP